MPKMPKVPKIEKTKNGARHTAHGKEYFEPQTHADGRRLFARPTWPAKNAKPSGQEGSALPSKYPEAAIGSASRSDCTF